MKAGDVLLLMFFEGKQQLQVPIYQRTYSWGIKHCTKLFEDIVRIGESSENKTHFIGSVVYFQPQITSTAGTPKKLLIDGQQRITTITLLLACLRDFIKNNPDVEFKDISSEEIRDLYLINPHKQGEDKYKLLLTKRDKESLMSIIDSTPKLDHYSKRIYDNFEYFISKVNQSNAAVIYKGIQKLLIVDAALEFGKDNPQLIFESLNSTGLDLSQADLIRNFVIMGQPKDVQDKIYANYWYPMEQLFGENIGRMTFFFRDYLTLKTGKIPNIEGIYEVFKDYIVSKKNLNIEDEASEFFEAAKHYTDFVLLRTTDTDIRLFFEDYKNLRVDVSYPLILNLFMDYSKALITKNELLEFLKIIESYVVRRAICEIPTNSMNKTFGDFHKNIDTADYSKSFKANFALLESYKRFPSDVEVVESLKKKNLYNFRSRAYFFGKLENFNRKERVNVESYTIEHVMPQSLSDNWMKMLGDNYEQVHKEKLHTIGNLTLTGYNSEMSNKGFLEKLNNEKGFKNSPLYLNDLIRQKTKWTLKEITEREEILIQRVLEIFGCIQIDAQTLEKYKKRDEEAIEEYSVDQFEMPDDIASCYEKLHNRILNLNPLVTREVKKLYIAYKLETNFVDIVPQKKRLWLTINMNIDQVYDPKELCVDITGQGKWGNGNVRIEISRESDIDYAMEIIVQSLQLQIE